MREFRLGLFLSMLGLLLFVAAVQGAGQDRQAFPGSIRHPEIRQSLGLERGSELILSLVTDTVKAPPTFNTLQSHTSEGKNTGRKSPVKAFMYSVLIPGAGQLYTGSKMKAAVFFGLEALGWAGYFSYHNKGNKRTDEFNTFADAHWSQTRYEDFLYLNWQVRDDEQVIDSRTGGPYFTHHLPDTKTQQYYEMIGKYNQFVFGWDDVNLPPDSGNIDIAYSANRYRYEDMRLAANNMFDRARTAFILTMVNHLLAGAEAALAANRHNKKLSDLADRVTVRAYAVTSGSHSIPMLNISYRF